MTYEKSLATIKSTATMPPEQALPTLIDCIKKGHTLAAAKAVKTIANLNHPDVVPSLIDVYDWLAQDPHKRDKGCDIRLAIAEAFGDIGSQHTIDTLRNAVRTMQIVRLGPTPEDIAIGLRATAALSLAKVDANALYELSLLLFDKKPDTPVSPISAPFVKAPVRKAAAQAIGILGDMGGMPLLAVKLKFPGEEVPEVLAECLESLIAMRPPYLIEIAKPYLTGSDEYLSAITALSLAENLGMDALDTLLDALECAESEAKEGIVIAISVIRGSNIRQILVNFLEHKNPFVRSGAKKGLEMLEG